MSAHIDLNNASADLPPPKRGRGRPRKNPPPPARPRPPDPDAPRVGGFAAGDMVWGKKLTHAAWPGLVYSAGDNGTGHDGQLLVSYFGDKAFAWCDAAELRPYEPYFPVAELYDDGGEDFHAAVEASLDEFSRRVEAALAGRPFVPADFIASLHDLAADRMGFTNRVQAAIAKAHLRAFDAFRALPEPPHYTLELGLLPDTPANNPKSKSSPAAAFSCDSSASAPTPSRRGRKRKEEAAKDDSDEDWDPRKKGATDSESDLDFNRKRASSRGGGRGGGGAPRARPRGRPRKTDRDAHLKDEDMEEKLDYPSAADMLLQLLSVAADPVNGNYDSVPVIVSFFSKHKDSEAPSVYQDKEPLEAFGCKKGRKKSVGSLGSATKAEVDSDEEQFMAADGQRGRRKSAGSLYSARKAEDSYWCDIIISDFDDGDSDYEGRKRKRPSQNTNRSANKKMKQEEAPQDGASTDPPADAKSGASADPPLDAKPVDGPAALILHFCSPEAIPSVDDINSIFRIHGPIVEGETEITKKSKIAKVVFSKRADAERAFSSLGKYNAFGPSLVTHEIQCLPSVPQVP
ncbi:hypothetical protein BAE44_0014760 [Dichanthelium oligosanthes]|uniref:PWWP domain-containing protein n=1 Tax=Dichanthelium oligosanthes TaxID=888268 RepID=A0A1E5VGG5_9POAL|nr:hypothetical protein BAE44_0014760 [Dichanthelium oligosanthes]